MANPADDDVGTTD